MVFGQNERQSPAISSFDKKRTVTIAGKESIEVPNGTLNSVLKQAGLKK
jgi:predicted RNA binding protein YcfA (HicA-like mRNA interferase family)